MKKLHLNKKTIQTLNKEQMLQIDGGLCIISCASGSRKGKACCGVWMEHPIVRENQNMEDKPY